MNEIIASFQTNSTTLSNTTVVNLYTPDVVNGIVVESVSLCCFLFCLVVILIVNLINKTWNITVTCFVYPLYGIQKYSERKYGKSVIKISWKHTTIKYLKQQRRKFLLHLILVLTLYLALARVTAQVLFVIAFSYPPLLSTHVHYVAHFITVSHNSVFVMIFSILIIMWFHASNIWVPGYKQIKFGLGIVLKLFLLVLNIVHLCFMIVSATTMMFSPITSKEVFQVLYATLGPIEWAIVNFITAILVIILGFFIIINVLRSPYLKISKKSNKMRKQIKDQINLIFKISVAVALYTIIVIVSAVGLSLVVVQVPFWIRQFWVRTLPSGMAILTISFLFAPINILLFCDLCAIAKQRKNESDSKRNSSMHADGGFVQQIFKPVEIIDEFNDDTSSISGDDIPLPDVVIDETIPATPDSMVGNAINTTLKQELKVDTHQHMKEREILVDSPAANTPSTNFPSQTETLFEAGTATSSTE